MFNQAVIEQLKYYVYFLKDPRNSEGFYVGKGVGNRLFQHLECALEFQTTNDKLDRIREIVVSGHSVQHYVLRHGLSEKESFEVEAAAIDLLGLGNLTNIQGGHHSGDFGLQTAKEISAMYDAEIFDPVDTPVLLVNLNRRYDREMTEEDLYQATRKSWKVGGDRRNKVEYAIATYRGLTREVYAIHRWIPVPENGANRWAFEGTLAPEDIRHRYRYKSIAGLFPPGAANPIKYICC